MCIFNAFYSCVNCIFCYDYCMKRTNFDFNQLMAFVAVAELESFKLAAEKIHLSPPALSRRIEKLEANLGVRLFNRTTREVKLTAIGRSLLDKVKGTLDELELTALNIKDIADSYVGQISIACIPSVIDHFLLAPLKSLLEKYPKIKVKILDGSETSIIENVLGGKADFGISFLSSATPGIIFEPIFDDRFIAIVPKESHLAKKKILGSADLKDQQLITVSQLSGNRQMLNQYFTSENLFPSIAIETNRASSVPNLVSAGLGIAIIPLLSFTQSNHPNLIPIQIASPSARREIGFIYQHGGSLSPAANQVVESIRKIVK